jgi:hypothetical protein
MEVKPIFVEQVQRIKILKPLRDSKGAIKYDIVLPYLVKVCPQDHPNFDLLLSLASYSKSRNGLSVSQAELANKFIKQFEINNSNIFYEPEIKGVMK